ncbi:hypothetical protein HYR54_07685 [Candidatus Acetothermia bacterium]|nr:hypothetical protein [Candidatus Acetothermia bacterium]
MERKTLKVSWAVYKDLQDFAEAQGLTLQAAVELRLNGSSLGIPPACVELLQERFSESLASPEKFREVLDYVAQAVRFYAGARKMLTCRVCGKFIVWDPDDELGQWLKNQAAQAGWHHGECES